LLAGGEVALVAMLLVGSLHLLPSGNRGLRCFSGASSSSSCPRAKSGPTGAGVCSVIADLLSTHLLVLRLPHTHGIMARNFGVAKRGEGVREPIGWPAWIRTRTN